MGFFSAIPLSDRKLHTTERFLCLSRLMNQQGHRIIPIEDQLPAHQGAHLAYHQQNGNGHSHLEEETGHWDLLRVFWHVVHYRWLIGIFLLTALVAGVIVNYLQTPYYRAVAQVEIKPDSAKVLSDLAVVSSSSDFRAFETIIQKMLSRDLASRVVFELDLANKADFVMPTPTFSLKNAFYKIFGFRGKNNFDKLSPEQRTKMAIAVLKNGLQVNLQRNTSILNVSFVHPDPNYTQLVANQVVLSYIDQSLDRRSTTSELARQFVQQKVAEAKEKLQESQKILVDYAEKEGINTIGENGSLATENISQLNKALSEAIQERLKIERLVNQIDNGNAGVLPGVFESESIQTTKQKIAELRATYQEKLSTFKPEFPEMRRLRAQILELQKQVQAEVNAIAGSIKIQFDQIKTKESALKAEIKELEKEQSAYQKKNIRYTILKGEVDSNRSQYESLVSKLNEVGVGAEIRSSDMSIVDQAVLPTTPYTPKLKVSLVIALLLGCAASAAAIFALGLTNNTFTLPDQIERDLKLSVLGLIPFLDQKDFAEHLASPHSAISEAYRTLRTSVQFAGVDSKNNLLSITSAEPSEGKTLTSVRLAEEFANLGKKVLLIDADLRKPKLHRMLDKHNNIGLSNLLTNIVQVQNMDPVFQTTHHPNLTFVSSGTIPPNPADILASEKMGLMLLFCKKRYDLVIVDGPPVIGLSDSPILSRQANSTLLVVSSKQVSRKSAINAVKRLRMSGANLIGVAMTKFSVEKYDYNYSYRYMSDNYYSYTPSDPEVARLEGSKHVDKKKQSKKGNPLSGIRRFLADIARKFD